MRYYIRNAVKALAKAVSFVVLVLFAVFNFLFKILKAIYQKIAIPVAVLGMVLIGYELFTGNVSAYNIGCMVFFVFMIALRYLLNPVDHALDRLFLSLKNFTFAPIVVRSPVRYTL